MQTILLLALLGMDGTSEEAEKAPAPAFVTEGCRVDNEILAGAARSFLVGFYRQSEDGENGSVVIWDGKARRELARLDATDKPCCALCLSPDGTLVAGAFGDSTVVAWNTATRKRLFTRKCLAEGVQFSPDGAMLAVGRERAIDVLEVATGKLRVSFDDDVRIPALRGNQRLSFSADGRLLAATGNENQVIVWDVVRGKLKTRLIGHRQVVNSVCFFPSGHKLASGGDGLRIWDADKGKELANFNDVLELGGAPFIQIAQDGKTLVSGWQDLCVWDLATMKFRGCLLAKDGSNAGAALMPDGKTVYTVRAHELRRWTIPAHDKLQRRNFNED